VSRPILVLLVLFLAAVGGWPQTQRADSELNLGLQAYRQARFDEAIRHFESAVVLDPYLVSAHSYLGAALVAMYIPGVQDPANEAYGKRAIEAFQKVIELEPRNVVAIREMAKLYFQMKELELARESYERVTTLDPNDPEAYYSIGVIRWTETLSARMELRARLGLQLAQPLISMPECSELYARNWSRVDDGIKALIRAIELRPDYDDAMAYLNLLYRERADLQCGHPRAHADDLAIADSWVEMTMKVKKAKQEKARFQQRPN